MGPGLYVHIPFCKRRCGYCDFYVEVAEPPLRERTLEAIVREAEIRRPSVDGLVFDSLYLGGGTPTLLGAELLGRLLDRLESLFEFEKDAERTIEANPESATQDVLEAARASGINRLSLGIQSFDDGELRFLNRLHDATAAREAIGRAREAGLSNISCDLIYGLPGHDEGGVWETSLKAAVEYKPTHLSCYLLQVEPTVPIGREIASGTVRLAGDGAARRAYDRARRVLGRAGYEQYEISNWAKPAGRCRHHLNVWQGGDYLGLGPGAHGYLGRVRRANAPKLHDYLSSLEEGREPPCTEEEVGDEQLAEEAILLGLRLREGIEWGRFEAMFGPEKAGRIRERAAQWISQGLMEGDGERIRVADEGLFVTNALTVSLLDSL